MSDYQYSIMSSWVLLLFELVTKLDSHVIWKRDFFVSNTVPTADPVNDLVRPCELLTRQWTALHFCTRIIVACLNSPSHQSASCRHEIRQLSRFCTLISVVASGTSRVLNVIVHFLFNLNEQCSNKKYEEYLCYPPGFRGYSHGRRPYKLMYKVGASCCWGGVQRVVSKIKKCFSNSNTNAYGPVVIMDCY